MLKSFAPNDRADMVKDGKVVVTCEFCSSVYEFTPEEAGVEVGFGFYAASPRRNAIAACRLSCRRVAARAVGELHSCECALVVLGLLAVDGFRAGGEGGRLRPAADPLLGLVDQSGLHIDGSGRDAGVARGRSMAGSAIRHTGVFPHFAERNVRSVCNRRRVTGHSGDLHVAARTISAPTLSYWRPLFPRRARRQRHVSRSGWT